jgi:hypothetical protein
MADLPPVVDRLTATPPWRVRLAWKLAAAALPPLVLVGAACGVWLRVGEFVTAAQAVQAQSSDRQVLFGQAYSNRTRAYKWHAVRLRRPEVLALGSSRVLQFRSEAFSSRFFNAGGNADCLEDLGAFLFDLPEDARPAQVIVGLDQWWFNGTYTAPGCRSDQATESPALSAFTGAWLDTWWDALAGKFTLADVLAAPRVDGESRIGLNAWLNRNGFRNDGSYLYGGIIGDPENPAKNADYRFLGTIARIRAGAARFTPGRSVDDGRVSVFREFLRQCRARRIHVTAFLPPFPRAVLNAMHGFRGRFDYMEALPSRLGRVAAEEGVFLGDMTDLAALGFSDLEAIDGYHCSEKAYLAVLIRLAQSDPTLASHVNDPKALAERLAQARGRFVVF